MSCRSQIFAHAVTSHYFNLTTATVHSPFYSLPCSHPLFSSLVSLSLALCISFSLSSSSYAHPLTSFLQRFDQRSNISAGVFKEREGPPVLFSLSYPAVSHLSVLLYPLLPYFLLTLVFLLNFSPLALSCLFMQNSSQSRALCYNHACARISVSATLSV